IAPADDAALAQVLAMGCWSERETVGFGAGADWHAELQADDGSEFDVFRRGQRVGRVRWALNGRHNVSNALGAIAAAHHVGVRAADAVAACADFASVKRRMEVVCRVNGITVYDDFAHHPTAIAATLEGLRARVGGGRIVAVIEPRSNTMRLGTHLQQLAPATAAADEVIWYQPPGLDWPLEAVVAASGGRA